MPAKDNTHTIILREPQRQGKRFKGLNPHKKGAPWNLA